MLPQDAKRRKAKAKDEAEAQATLDSHLRERPHKEHTVPYTDPVFRQAAIEWLVSTDQVCSNGSHHSRRNSDLGFGQPIHALEHPAFRNMINIAARATDGVKIPGRKQTRQEIIDMFKARLTELRNRLRVSVSDAGLSYSILYSIPQSERVKGLISLSCDAYKHHDNTSFCRDPFHDSK